MVLFKVLITYRLVCIFLYLQYQVPQKEHNLSKDKYIFSKIAFPMKNDTLILTFIYNICTKC